MHFKGHYEEVRYINSHSGEKTRLISPQFSNILGRELYYEYIFKLGMNMDTYKKSAVIETDADEYSIALHVSIPC